METEIKAMFPGYEIHGKDTILMIKERDIRFLGPNGVGKTTAFSVIIGLINTDEGKILYNDTNISENPMYKRAQMRIILLS